MDTQKIGNFLKELRKQNNMTQEQLGEKIGVTNKTVSRWETGNYMPPIESLKLLSDLYQISINEILAGEMLNEEDYKEAAEENIVVAMEGYKRDEKTFTEGMVTIMLITSVMALISIELLSDVSDMSALTEAAHTKLIIAMMLILLMLFIGNAINIVAICLGRNK